MRIHSTMLVLALVGLAPCVRAQEGDLATEVQALREEVRELRAMLESEREIELPSRIGKPVDDIQRMLEENDPSFQLPGALSISVSGELRTRSEYRSNLYSPADPRGHESFDLTHMRSRLRFDVDVEEDIEAIFELQDVRTWGDEGSTIADTEGVDLKRGAIVVRNIHDEPLSLELGRTVFFYGDQRLVGHLEWFDQGRSYDGLRLSYDPDGYFVDVFGARIRDDAVGATDAQDLIGIYGGVSDVAPSMDVEGYALLFRDQMKLAGERAVGNTQFVTLGTRLVGEADEIDYTGEFAFQTGEVNDDDLQAFAFAVKGGYTLPDTDWTPRFGVEVDYASGNDSAADGDNETFQTLFPTNHVHYGYADLVGWSNMFALRGTVSVNPREDLTVSVDLHHFRLVDPDGGWINAGGAVIRPGIPGASRDLGDEIDLLFTWKATQALSVLAGWSHFFPGGFVDDTGSDPGADFLYLQARVRF